MLLTDEVFKIYISSLLTNTAHSKPTILCVLQSLVLPIEFSTAYWV
jgi:hypothetical protein